MLRPLSNLERQTGPDSAGLAQLIGEPARHKMLMALMGGQALTASELADCAEITAQTASSHLAKLVGGNVLREHKQGRHKYFLIGHPEVAEVLESLLNLSQISSFSSHAFGPKDPDLCFARVCYDHLAGSLAVDLCKSLIYQGYLLEVAGSLAVSSGGTRFFEDLGFVLKPHDRRPQCRLCMDWSERKFHLAGHLGFVFLQNLFANGWAKKDPDSRTVLFSKSGLSKFKRQFQLS